MTVFEFATAGRVLFGRGTSSQAVDFLRGFGDRVLVVVGSSTARHTTRLEALRRAGLSLEVFSIPGEPTVEIVREGVAVARRQPSEVVLGLGGGSALDAAKAIAILAAHGGDVLDYLEVVGAGKSFEHPGLPTVAIPTTAGTGTEVTRNAVLASPQHGVKVSLRSPHLLPRVAIVDPDLSSEMPPELTARVGLDALTQLIEPFVSTRANALTDAVCREGLALAAPSLLPAYRDGSDEAAREAMAAAALLSGIALANAGLGVVHGLAGPIGGMVAAPHGAICAALLPHGMRVNLRAMRQRSPDAPGASRYDELGRRLTGRPQADADEAVAWIRELVADLAIPRLAAYGLTSEMIPAIVERAAAASSTRSNPIVLNQEELLEIATAAL